MFKTQMWGSTKSNSKESGKTEIVAIPRRANAAFPQELKRLLANMTKARGGDADRTARAETASNADNDERREYADHANYGESDTDFDNAPMASRARSAYDPNADEDDGPNSDGKRRAKTNRELEQLRQELEILKLSQQISQLQGKPAPKRPASFTEVEHAISKFSGDDIGHPVRSFIVELEEVMANVDGDSKDNFKLLTLRCSLTETARLFLATTKAFDYKSLKQACFRCWKTGHDHHTAESKYHSFELETLAIIYALERFRVHLNGIPFTIITDCNSLALSLGKKQVSRRITRWALELEHYNYTIQHRKGYSMKHVDVLSRRQIAAVIGTDEVEL